LELPLARKTKCDGAHPACQSCTRRSLPCSYIHDAPTSSGHGHKKVSRRASNPKAPSPPSVTASSSSHASRTVVSTSDLLQKDAAADDNVAELKRVIEEPESPQSRKKIRTDGNSPSTACIP